ncbi:hypothetical protein LSAT2_013057 [Lamellibrachia satsuma]|nr:hypothetical protein LSAT2_013057 [Lamellibrachia satsuma]
MNEKDRLEQDNDAAVLISSTSEDSEGTSGIEEYNVAITGPSISDLSPNPCKRAHKNGLNPDLAAALDIQKELDTELQSTKSDMEDITAKYENEKCKTEWVGLNLADCQCSWTSVVAADCVALSSSLICSVISGKVSEMAGQLELLKAELASTCAQLERASRSLEVVREESRQKAQLVAGLQKEVRRLEDRMNVLEYRCMDVEKLEIAVENGRKAFEAKQQQLSLSEHEVRALTRSVEEQQQVITETEARITTMTAQVDDLKIQVREEVIKNVSLEEVSHQECLS